MQLATFEIATEHIKNLVSILLLFDQIVQGEIQDVNIAV